MDFGSILAMARQRPSSIPGLLQMLRGGGGDPQEGGGGGARPAPAQGQERGMGQLQAAQSAMDGGGGARGGGMSGGGAGLALGPGTGWPGSGALTVGSELGEQDYGNTTTREAQGWVIPGWVQNGHVIGADKYFQDTHRPISDPASAGSLHPYHGSNNANAWSTTGEQGYFGQMDPWMRMWGSGGP